MKIAFKDTSNIEQGGAFEALFYNRVVLPDKRREEMNGKILIEADDDDIPYSWLANNYGLIHWRGLDVFVEAPSSYKTVNVPAWLPQRTYIDENEVEQIHTFDSWGGVVRERLDNTKIVIKITAKGDLTETQMASTVSAIAGNNDFIGMTVGEARALVTGVDYQAPE